MLLGAGVAFVVLAVLLALAAYRFGWDEGQMTERAVWLERDAARRQLVQQADRGHPPVEFLLGPVPDFTTRELRAAP